MDYYTSFELMVSFLLVNNKTLHCGYKFIFPVDNKTGSTHTHTHTHTQSTHVHTFTRIFKTYYR